MAAHLRRLLTLDDLGGVRARSTAAPATDKDGRTTVRPEFCGWSALGPISMLIEHVLGFRVDATTQTVRADPDGDGRQGLRA